MNVMDEHVYSSTDEVYENLEIQQPSGKTKQSTCSLEKTSGSKCVERVDIDNGYLTLKKTKRPSCRSYIRVTTFVVAVSGFALAGVSTALHFTKDSAIFHNKGAQFSSELSQLAAKVAQLADKTVQLTTKGTQQAKKIAQLERLLQTAVGVRLVNGNTVVGIRLVNGSNANSGRVEVFASGLWGTVCDDGLDLGGTKNRRAAKVICQELGKPSAYAKIWIEAKYGQGTGPIWFDDVNCTGDEAMLMDCSHAGVGNHNCGHGEDIGVTCQ